MMMTTRMSALLLLSAAAAFAPVARRVPRATSLRASDAATLFEAQEAAMGRIKAQIPLEAKDYPASLGLDASLTSYEAPGSPNVAWCSDLRLAGDTTIASLTVWCGPLKDVPHLVARTVLTEDAVSSYVDFRPRADVGYATVLEDGTFPPPDSREAFMAKGQRTDLDDRFYAAAGELAAAYGGDAAPAPTDDREREQRSLVAVDGSAARSPEAVAAAAKLASDAVDLWLTWASDDAHDLKPGMQVTSTYARDTKVRANNYALLVDTYTGLLGDGVGPNLAAGDAGPLDEAYVGGAS